MRTVASILTINKDLERIGDLSVNLAEQAILLANEPVNEDVPYALSEEAERVVSMVNRSLNSLVRQNSTLAREVLDDDDEVDRIHRQMYQHVKQGVARSPERAGSLIDLLVASRQLERIADHAVNIAEDVIYMVDGELVRHNHLQDAAR
jgi:phosphate transport system protein